MILGIGNDIIDIRRIEKTLERFGDRFVRRLFTDTEQKRSDNRDPLNATIADVIRTKSAAAWVDILNEAGVPCGPIYTIDKMFDDPQVKHLGMTGKVRSAEFGEMEFVGQPINMSRTPSSLASASPACGAHSDEILADLGYDADAIADLRQRNVI